MEQPLLISSLDTGERSASHSGRFNPKKETPVPTASEADWTQGKSGRCGNRKISGPSQGSNPDSMLANPVLSAQSGKSINKS